MMKTTPYHPWGPHADSYRYFGRRIGDQVLELGVMVERMLKLLPSKEQKMVRVHESTLLPRYSFLQT